MKQLSLFIILLGLFVFSESNAQTRYLVNLKNKAGTSFTFSNPSAYLSQRAIDRRTKYGIAIDSTDLPPTPAYISQIRNVPNVTILNISRWLNSVSIQTSDPNAIITINGFSFVQSVSGIAARGVEGGVPSGKFDNEVTTIEQQMFERTLQTGGDFYNYGNNSFNEINFHKGQFLHNIGLRGQGMRIAMLDAGFTNFINLRSFDSININNQVLETWDFVSGHANVNDHSHGMQCLSTIAANIPGEFVGKAPKASFYLYRTEDAPTEYPIEEHNWACGAERADSIGADVISSSLGYSDFDPPFTGSSYTYADMNGNTTMAAIAADLAAKKGILVLNSAGNSGNSPWRYLITPSDGDSVIAVGAVDTLGNVAGFSSYGPSSDGQVKPDLASIGLRALVQTSGNNIGASNGTSFSCPNMAGLATCLWQGFPEFNNMKIVKALQQAGSIAATPDDRIGYGIPDMKKAFTGLLVEYATSSAILNSTNCTITLSWSSKDVADMKYEIERKTPADIGYIKISELNPQAGTILSNRNYQFINNISNVPAGTISYRIRQVLDTSAASFTDAYIDTALINHAAVCTSPPVPDLIKVVPNPPVSNIAKLEVETGYAVPNMQIHIYDMSGKRIMMMRKSKGIGTETFDIPIGKFANGTYMVSVYSADKLIGTTKFMKL